MAQVSTCEVPSVWGTQPTPFDIVCKLSGGFVFSLKGQGDFSERVQRVVMHVKNLIPDLASIPLKNDTHLI